jgi:hypothetical protein
MVKTKTTKKVSKGCPEGQVPDGKGGCMPKPKIVKIVKPTADSTAYYKDEAIFQSNLGVLKSKYGLKKQAEEAMAKSRKAYSNASRQKFKGKPGYDKNGFPIKKKG